AAVYFLDGVDRYHMLIVDRRGGPSLADEPAARGTAGRQGLRQHLDRDNPLQDLVEGLEYQPHAAAADDPLHLVVTKLPGARRIGGRLEKVERLRVALGRLRDRIEFTYDLRHRLPKGQSWRQRLMPQLRSDAGPEIRVRRQALQRRPASLARRQMIAER